MNNCFKVIKAKRKDYESKTHKSDIFLS